MRIKFRRTEDCVRAMPKKWTALEEREKYEELLALYVRQHKTIFEIGRILG